MTWASLLLPAAAFALLAAARRRAGGPARGTVLAYFTLAAILAATVLVSTALEPWPGQLRYRYPLQHLHVVVAAAGAALVVGALAPPATRPRGRCDRSPERGHRMVASGPEPARRLVPRARRAQIVERRADPRAPGA